MIFALDQETTRRGIAAADIESIEVARVLGSTEYLFTHQRPSNHIGAQFSMPYAAAMACLHVPLGEWGQRTGDTEVLELADRVKLYQSEKSIADVARINAGRDVRSPWLYESDILVRAGGVEIEFTSEYGQASRDDIVRKWAAWNPPANLDAILDAVDSIEDMDDVNELTALLRNP